MGFNGAREAMAGGRAYRDANGVSNYDRIHDISRNGDGLDKRMTAVRLDPSETPVGKTVTPSASVAQADHPEHGRYREMYAMLGAVSGLASQPVEKSTAQLGALAPQPDPLAEAQRQERTRLV